MVKMRALRECDFFGETLEALFEDTATVLDVKEYYSRKLLRVIGKLQKYLDLEIYVFHAQREWVDDYVKVKDLRPHPVKLVLVLKREES